jgi:RNA polymerase sigma factor (sigma-70 family)
LAKARSADAKPPLDVETDLTLMALVERGDADAFRTVIDRHLMRVQRLAARMLGDVNEAEEVAQDAFLRLWMFAKSWHPGPDNSVVPWLRRVATNLCLDRLRRRRFISDVEPPDRPDPAALAPAVIDAERVYGAVKRSLLSVPDRQRAALVLTYYEELSNAEAARTMDMHVKAFESLLLRARATLRTALTRRGLTVDDVRGLA